MESIARVIPQQLSWRFMVAIRSKDETWIFNFLPNEPTDSVVLIQLLTLGEIPGRLLLSKVVFNKCGLR